MTCRSCTARHMPSSNFDLKSVPRVMRHVSYAQRRAKLVQGSGLRLVQVRVAPQRSVSIGQRASAVHGRCPFVHVSRSANTERPRAQGDTT